MKRIILIVKNLNNQHEPEGFKTRTVWEQLAPLLVYWWYGKHRKKKNYIANVRFNVCWKGNKGIKCHFFLHLILAVVTRFRTCGLAGRVVLGWRLDLVMLEVFSSLDDSVICSGAVCWPCSPRSQLEKLNQSDSVGTRSQNRSWDPNFCSSKLWSASFLAPVSTGDCTYTGFFKIIL